MRTTSSVAFPLLLALAFMIASCGDGQAPLPQPGQSLGFFEGYIDVIETAAGPSYDDLEQQRAASDLVIVARISDVKRGRVVERAPGIALMGFAEMTLRASNGNEYIVEVPFEPYSEALEAALQAAVDWAAVEKIDQRKPGADALLAAAIDDRALRAAHLEFGDGAIDETVERFAANIPRGEFVFFLTRMASHRSETTGGDIYQVIGPTGLVTADQEGRAVVPLAGHAWEDSGAVSEIEAQRFEDFRIDIEKGRGS